MFYVSNILYLDKKMTDKMNTKTCVKLFGKALNSLAQFVNNNLGYGDEQ